MMLRIDGEEKRSRTGNFRKANYVSVFVVQEDLFLFKRSCLGSHFE